MNHVAGDCRNDKVSEEWSHLKLSVFWLITHLSLYLCFHSRCQFLLSPILALTKWAWQCHPMWGADRHHSLCWALERLSGSFSVIVLCAHINIVFYEAFPLVYSTNVSILIGLLEPLATLAVWKWENFRNHRFKTGTSFYYCSRWL